MSAASLRSECKAASACPSSARKVSRSSPIKFLTCDIFFASDEAPLPSVLCPKQAIALPLDRGEVNFSDEFVTRMSKLDKALVVYLPNPGFGLFHTRNDV